MKNRKLFFKSFLILILLSYINIGSCKKDCEVCKKINPITFEVTDTQTACEDFQIEHFESRGYSCNPN